MANDDQFSDMPLTRVVKDWMVSEEWKDEISVGEDRSRSQMETSFSINDNVHTLYFDVNESKEGFAVYLYSPYNVPAARMGDLARLLNRINGRLRLGRFFCLDDEDANTVEFKVMVDVEGGQLTPTMISTLLGASVSSFKQYGELLAGIALTKQPMERLWSEFLEQEAAAAGAQGEGDEEVPTEL